MLLKTTNVRAIGSPPPFFSVRPKIGIRHLRGSIPSSPSVFAAIKQDLRLNALLTLGLMEEVTKCCQSGPKQLLGLIRLIYEAVIRPQKCLDP
jgi:hypothetical protein